MIKYIIAISVVAGIFIFQNKTLQIESQFSTINLERLENLVDSNLNVWKDYQDAYQNIFLKYPFYLSDFRDLSADSQLTNSNEKVASYVRKTNYSGEGRSYWIILGDPFPNTKKLDVKEWIVKNNLNVTLDDSGKKTELEIEEVTLGNQVAWVVNLLTDEVQIPVDSRVYFQTKDGIRYLGYHSFSAKNTHSKDYEVFTQILSLVSFRN